ncbi:MAG TPA: UDP-4-amino-4,6-dideoxy-N-acetyl-beta-L-altrosamine transaminase [Polyangia bacterium]|nr:UDP-4-amino-4,6-dideoxy-N-acetyl-beta-L-altrosamine transaminase [Polyangia bacterium]
MIPYGRQSISQADIDAVVATLRSDFLTQGPAVDRFEERVAAYCGAAGAVAVSSATAALHIACLAAGLGKGDLCWTSPNSFVASANCAVYCGADVDFVDIAPDTYNMDAAALERKLAAAKRLGRLPKVVIPVHFSGQACRMDAIGQLAARYGFTVIEDASHAIGARFAGDTIGGCRHSAMTVFSFHPVKIITTGEGGIITTNDPALRRRLLRLRSHGITRDPADMDGGTAAASSAGQLDDPWYYQQVELGFNYRMTDIQAALGTSQLERVDVFVARRAEIAAAYDRLLADLAVIRPARDPDARSSHHLYAIQLDAAAGARRARRDVFRGLRARGVGVNVHYIPIPTQPFYRRRGFSPESVPVALAYYQNAITLPLHAAMTDGDVKTVVAALEAEL